MAENNWLINDSIPVGLSQEFSPAPIEELYLLNDSIIGLTLFNNAPSPWSSNYFGGPSSMLFPVGGSIISFPADFSASSSNVAGLSLIGVIVVGFSGGSSLVVSTSTLVLFTVNASASSTLIAFLTIIVPPISFSTSFNASSQLTFTSGTINGIIILP